MRRGVQLGASAQHELRGRDRRDRVRLPNEQRSREGFPKRCRHADHAEVDRPRQPCEVIREDGKGAQGAAPGCGHEE